MHIPPHFRETDPARIHELIDLHGFATLVSQVAGAPFATHLPLLFDAEAGEKGRLYGHFARANPQAREEGAEMLAIFHGPHAYVSASWYARAGVPTWNYAVVHVRGRLRWIEDEETAFSLLEALTEKYDFDVADPTGEVLPEAARRAMLQGVRAFFIEIGAIDAKFKLSQNRDAEDRQRVIGRLGQSDHPDAHAISGLMLENLVKERAAGMD